MTRCPKWVRIKIIELHTQIEMIDRTLIYSWCTSGYVSEFMAENEIDYEFFLVKITVWKILNSVWNNLPPSELIVYRFMINSIIFLIKFAQFASTDPVVYGFQDARTMLALRCCSFGSCHVWCMTCPEFSDETTNDLL